MAYRLFVDSNNGVTICPEWNYSSIDEKIQVRHKAKSGFSEVYKFGDFDAIKFDVRYVNSSDASIVNSWWESNAELLFMREGETSVFSCMIMNNRLPIGGVEKPYYNQFKGTIELGEY